MTHIEGVAVAPQGVPVYNPAFDVTPHRYLTAIVTEEGVCYPPFDKSLRAAKSAANARVEANRLKRGMERGMTRIGRMNADRFLIRENPPNPRDLPVHRSSQTMNLLRSVCVYCGSSMGTKEVYRHAAESMGRELVSRGLRLVYGAGSVGLMGVLARTVYERGGDVLGIIPDVLAPR